MLTAERPQTIEPINVHVGDKCGQRRRLYDDPRKNALRAIAYAADRDTRWLSRSIMTFDLADNRADECCGAITAREIAGFCRNPTLHGSSTKSTRITMVFLHLAKTWHQTAARALCALQPALFPPMPIGKDNHEGVGIQTFLGRSEYA